MSLPTVNAIDLRYSPKMTLFRSVLFSLLALGCGLRMAYGAPPTETIDGLQRKRTVLEQELERVTARITTLEAQQAAKSSEQPRVTYFIKDFGINDVNSAGGVEPYFVLLNPDPANVIKYMRIRVTPYNAVGDVIGSTIGGETITGLSFTGPLAQSDGEKRLAWEPVWYNNTATCIRVNSVQVIFVNGKTQMFTDKNLRVALPPELDNQCKMKK